MYNTLTGICIPNAVKYVFLYEFTYIMMIIYIASYIQWGFPRPMNATPISVEWDKPNMACVTTVDRCAT